MGRGKQSYICAHAKLLRGVFAIDQVKVLERTIREDIKPIQYGSWNQDIWRTLVVQS